MMPKHTPARIAIGLAGEFTFVHTIVADSQGDLYLAETAGGRRNQKFTRVSD